MNKELEFEEKVEGLGNIYKIDGPFNASLRALNNKGIKYPISARDLAYARIQKGKKSFLCNDGNYVEEGIVCIPQKGIFLTKNSPVLISSKEATDAHRKNNEFYITKEQAEKSLKNSVKVLYNIKEIPTNRFNEEEITLWLFKDQAENYGNFLRDTKINEMPLYLNNQDYIDKQESSFANQLWFSNLVLRSSLDCNNWYLNYNSLVRGIFKKF